LTHGESTILVGAYLALCFWKEDKDKGSDEQIQTIHTTSRRIQGVNQFKSIVKHLEASKETKK
jgi:hypothetical protein